KLTAKLGTLTLKPQTGAPDSTKAGTFTGKRYTFGTNTESIEAVTLDSTNAGGDVALTIRMGGVDQHVTASRAGWRKGTMTFRGAQEPIAASGGWTADDTYALRIVRYRTPFAATYQLRFTSDQLVVDSEQNVGNTDTRIAHFTGTTSGAAAPSH